jgi:hypothetical protein
MPHFPSPSAENLFGPSAYMPVESTYQNLCRTGAGMLDGSGRVATSRKMASTVAL